MNHTVELILNGVKYRLLCTRNGPHTFSVSVLTDHNDHDDDDGRKSVATGARALSDGGYLIDIGGQSHVAYLTGGGGAGGAGGAGDAGATGGNRGMKMSVSGANVIFAPDYDPRQLRTEVAGKLVRRCKREGDSVKKGEPYAEIEVMKMILPLKVEESGVLSQWKANEGAPLSAGDLLATLQLENPDNVSKVTLFHGDLQVAGWGESTSTSSGSNNNTNNKRKKRPHLMLRSAMEKLTGACAGYILSREQVDSAFDELAAAAAEPTLPVYEIEEQLSVLSGRIPGELFKAISAALRDFSDSCEKQAGSGVQLRFPANEIASMLSGHSESLDDAGDRTALAALTTPLQNAVQPYTKSRAAGVPGSERVLSLFLDLLRRWIGTERWFCDSASYADAVDRLRKAHKDDAPAVLEVCRAHERLPDTARMVERIVTAIGDATRVDLDDLTTTTTTTTSSSTTTTSSTSKTTSPAVAMGKRLSVVAGAESLPSAMPALSEMGVMGGQSDRAYAAVALRARKLILQESMPSLEQRRQRVLRAAQRLSKGGTDGGDGKDTGTLSTIREVEELIADRIPLADVFFSLLQSSESPEEQLGLVELYARHIYSPYTVQGFERNCNNGGNTATVRSVKFTFWNKPSESVLAAATSVTSMTDLSRMLSSGSLGSSSSETPGGGAAAAPTIEGGGHQLLAAAHNKERIPPSTLRTGVCVLLDSLDDLDGNGEERAAGVLDSSLSLFPPASATAAAAAAPVNVLYFFLRDTVLPLSESGQDEAARRCQAILAPATVAQQLQRANVRRVSFVFDQERTDDESYESSCPVLFSFRFPEFVEDALYRNIDPSLAMHLDLNRVAAKFDIRSLGTRHTSACHVHLYLASPRGGSVCRSKKAASAPPRVFTRTLSFGLDFGSSSFERILVDSLNAMDLCNHQQLHPNAPTVAGAPAHPPPTDNHLFLNLVVSDYEKAVLDPVVVEQVVLSILKRHGDRISGLDIAEVETRIVCRLSADSPPITMRLFASNPTGYVHVMNTYIEAAGGGSGTGEKAGAGVEAGGDRVFKLIGGTKASLASAGDSSWDGLNVNTPYPVVRPFDAQRKVALKASDTLYCYDLPALIEAAVERQWVEASAQGGIEGGIRAAARPLMVM